MNSTCQRCLKSVPNHWTVVQAEFHISTIQYWKVQLCEGCTGIVRDALLQALAGTSREASTPGEEP